MDVFVCGLAPLGEHIVILSYEKESPQTEVCILKTNPKYNVVNLYFTVPPSDVLSHALICIHLPFTYSPPL